MTSFFTFAKNDLLKGLIVAVLAAVATWLAQVLNAPGFDWYAIQWDEVVRIAVMAGTAYLSKALLTTKEGAFLGAVKL